MVWTNVPYPVSRRTLASRLSCSEPATLSAEFASGATIDLQAMCTAVFAIICYESSAIRIASALYYAKVERGELQLRLSQPHLAEAPEPI